MYIRIDINKGRVQGHKMGQKNLPLASPVPATCRLVLRRAAVSTFFGSFEVTVAGSARTFSNSLGCGILKIGEIAVASFGTCTIGGIESGKD